jgi:DNA polymerase-3 subunit chi
VTEIDFHFNAPDKIGHTCRLLRKAVTGRGARLVVTGGAPLLEAVDAALWQLAPSDFVAHCRSDAEAHVAERSPVLLTPTPGDALPQQRPVLVNLGDDVPTGFERFDRLIEIVTGDDADRQAARRRWRHYADRGYAIRRHDLAQERSV